MYRRHFLVGASSLATGTRTAGQIAHPRLRPGESESLVPGAGSLPDPGWAGNWFNTVPLTRRSLRGKVVLFNFWTYSCINSLRPLPYLKNWAKQYTDSGLVVLGVHTPEFSFEKDQANVGWAVREFNIGYPVAMDNDYRIWHALQNAYWPAFYLIDGRGRVRFRRFGEGQYEESERALRVLLADNGVTAGMSDPVTTPAASIEAPPGNVVQTPETYVGYARADRFSSVERVARDARRTYTAPARLDPNHWALSGVWQVGAESGLLREARGKLMFRFHSRDLHLILAPAEHGKPVPFRLTLDGTAPGADAGTDSAIDGTGEIREPRLYQLVRQKDRVRDRLLEIEFLVPGVRAFSLTFG
ncbi:MAG TPA: redoxin domain-containing protein [Bryobacteraceae bacterium]|nr:redoxin domain-containing protein [Bryobacteraceae bacterium]